MTIEYACGKILNLEKRIFISKIHTPKHPLGLASAFPHLFRQSPSLHFLSLSWWLGDVIEHLVKALKNAVVELPNARFVVIAGDEEEAFILNQAGVDCILGNPQIFINENHYQIINLNSKYDAIYHAVLTPFKNHHLCVNIQNIALIHQRFDKNSNDEDSIRHLLPQAKIINEKTGPNSYIFLNQDELNTAINQAKVGLSLSQVDGACHEVMAYLLCGTPVVTVSGKGGKDRFLVPSISEFADPNSDSVAAAVDKLIARNISKEFVRETTLTLLQFERSHFIKSYNHYISHYVGDNFTENSFERFIDVFEWKSIDDWTTAIEVNKALSTSPNSSSKNYEETIIEVNPRIFIKQFLAHYVSVNLIRVGEDSDGGYLIPDIRNKVSHCFSPGVDYMASFEESLARSHNIRTFMADASVQGPPLESEHFYFIKKFIGNHSHGDYITLSDWMNSTLKGDEGDLILQMDIEGGEYDVLEFESSELLARFSVMVIEFHHWHLIFDPQFLKRLNSIFNKIYENFSICHVHPNNCCGIHKSDGVEVPPVLEITFIRNDQIESFINPEPVSLPHKLDRKNVPHHDEIFMPTAWWKK